MVTVGSIWPGSPTSTKRSATGASSMKSAQGICHASSMSSVSNAGTFFVLAHFAVVATTTAESIGSSHAAWITVTAGPRSPGS